MILHMDMDAFFASVEQRDNPELRGKPVIISGRSMRSVVSTASYEARIFGVRSAMPLVQAMKLCPQAVVVRGRMGRYKEVSKRIFALIQNMSPLVEQVSIDEAYLDVSGCERLLGSPVWIAETIKAQIKERENLTCSIGIAPLKFIAKIASDMNKPDGITVIDPGKVMDFIENLPIGKVPGVGVAALRNMESLGVKTLGQIRKLDDRILKAKFGVFGHRLKQLSLGEDSSQVTLDYERKSYSTETTLPEDTFDREFLNRQLLAQSDEVARLLRRGAVKARTITLKITFADFKQITRRHTLENPAQSSEQIYKEALRLFSAEILPTKIRLIGVGASGLMPANQPVQALLFTDNATSHHEKWEKADRAVDSILEKFGTAKVKRAATVTPDEKPSS
jgi:DNA polymerase-4